MKKFLSLLLAAAMLIAIAVTAVVVVSAVDGDWSVYTVKSQYLDGYADFMHDVPGYEYTDEGLKMIPAAWRDSTPYATFQTTEPVYIKEGVYLKVRVDEFSYDAGDKFFAFSIWDQENVELGKQGEEYGYGVETLIRHRGTTGNDALNYDASNPTTWPGAKTTMEWYKDLEEGQRETCKNTSEYDSWYNYEFDENGCPILTLRIEWDDANEMCVVYINDVPAPDEYNSALKRCFEPLDYMAYVGFTLSNSKTGGTAACTILEWGTSADDAEPPMGDDSADPIVFDNQVAPIADASDIPVGSPAIILNGLKTDSNVAGNPVSMVGNVITVYEDGSINVLANTNNQATVKYIVNNDTSYAVEDFPIALAITRNFCTCTYTDNDGDGVVDAECMCNESLNSLALVGDIKQESSSFSAKSEPLYHFEPYYNGSNFYNYFLFDWSTIEGLSGRINGIRIDTNAMKGTDPERNNFDIVEIAFFRTMVEAEEYFNAWLESLVDGVIPDAPEDEPEIEAPEIEPDTEAPADDPEDDATTTESEEDETSSTEDETVVLDVDKDGYYAFVSYADGEDKIWEPNNKGIGSSAARMKFISDVDGAICFYAKTSSEAGCDMFRVYVNGIERMVLSGDTNYESYSISVSEGDEVIFEYKKDITVNSGDDTAYVKNVYFTKYTTEVSTESAEGDTQNWPDENGYYGFVCTEDNGDIIWTSNNQGFGSSIARKTITIERNGTMMFYVSVSSETSCDVLRVYQNGSVVVERSGSCTNEYVTIDVVEGDEIIFSYSKDGSVNSGTDTASIKNIAYTSFETSVPTEVPFEPATEVETETEAIEESGDEDNSYIETESETETFGEFETEEETYTSGEDGIYEFIEDENGNFMSTNNTQDSSVARKTISCEVGGLYQLYVNLSSESMCDKLVVKLGDKIVYVASGERGEFVDVYVSAGDVITIEYIKDAKGNAGSDRAVIGISFTEGAVPEIETSGSSSGSGTAPEVESDYIKVEQLTSIDRVVSGCFGTIGTGAAVIIVTAMFSLCAFRKKKD